MFLEAGQSYRAESRAWIDSMLPAPLTGPIEVTKESPWSLVATVPTAAGQLWFKENRAGTIYEAALVQALARWAPEQVLAPVAVEPARGWSLLPDGGTILRVAHQTPQVADWEGLLRRHAQLQRDLMPYAEEMLAVGVPDLRPKSITAHFERLSVPESYVDQLTEMGERLAASAIQPSLQHDDLHDANVFTSGRFFDWGDASVAHPFGVLLVCLRVASDRFGVPDRDPLLAHLRDVYLEMWSDLADRATLLAEVDAALQVTKVSRALSWERSLVGASAEDLERYGDNVNGWIAELAEPNVL
ncbi:MAG: phosphotransferase [Micromonosporaceae bacterium]